MSKIDLAKALELDPATLYIDILTRLAQVPGTDGSGGGAGVPRYERLSVAPNFSDGYVTLITEPVNVTSPQVFIENAAGEVSGPQFATAEFTIVRSTVGGNYDRLIWDSTKTSNGGNGTPIPDADPTPTLGMEDVMLSSFYIHIYYLS